MKKLSLVLFAAIIFLSSCATVQSIIKSTFPYTASLIIPASAKINATNSATSAASSFDQVFGNQKGSEYVKEVRIANAKIIALNPTSQSMGVFKSVKVYISNGDSGEVMVASRNDIGENIGNDLILDIDNSRFLDKYIKGNNLRIRMEYVLRKSVSTDVSVRASLNFSSSPNPQ
jgi:uncharacterized lipoprotein YajG